MTITINEWLFYAVSSPMGCIVFGYFVVSIHFEFFRKRVNPESEEEKEIEKFQIKYFRVLFCIAVTMGIIAVIYDVPMRYHKHASINNKDVVFDNAEKEICVEYTKYKSQYNFPSDEEEDFYNIQRPSFVVFDEYILKN